MAKKNGQDVPAPIGIAALPAWKSHKVVHAAKIAKVQLVQPDGADVTFDELPGVVVWVDGPYLRKHEPKAGGYLVVYEDGYQSWSPADAFEGGYSRA